MADKRISQLIERVTIANNDVLPIVASGATTTNKVTVSTLQDWMQNNLDVGVTSIGITIGSSGTDINVSGSPITTSGNITINIPTASATNRGLLSSSDWTTFNNKLSSVGLTMPSAFTVTNSPLTANGTIAVTGAGTVSQYIRGDGSLADFPEAGGGGASVSYYLNGSVSQGTIGGIAYREMNKTPILGAGTDFTIAADGYIASFITDAGDPSLLEIPGGNWNFESYFQASSGGGSPSFYIELYKVNSGGTATLIASNSSNPELIAFGTTTTAYFSTLAVPTTTLALTDRLAVRFYVTHSGRTITMHTENSNLCQVITTFTTGLTALNGLTAQVQNFATGTSGTDFAISSVGSTHTFNLPDASATARGVVSTNSQVFTGVKTFSNGLSLPAVGGTNQTTRIVNIGTLHEGTASVNQIGFNSGNNIYFGKGLNNGGVISWNNAAVRYYTLPDADGTIALTSQIPANPVGGTGTTNQIPKFSATSTLTNSNISDNGSDVVISSRTGISLSGQSILITPNLGGTTNRIETTGSLPLAIATSGASITLAAGGTTPQITLASTGAVTLTGALNGTSASFTGAVSSSSKYTWGSSTTGTTGQIATDGTNNYLDYIGNLVFRGAAASNTLATISSTGAATFSSSVTATGFNLGNGQFLRLTRSSGGLQYDALGIVAGTDNTRLISTGDFDVVNGALSSQFKISSTGAATFTGNTVAANGSVNIEAADPALRFRVTGGTANSRIYEWRAVAAGGVNDIMQLRLWNDAQSSASTLMSVTPSGAATFSSSVTAGGNSNASIVIRANGLNNTAVSNTTLWADTAPLISVGNSSTTANTAAGFQMTVGGGSAIAGVLGIAESTSQAALGLYSGGSGNISEKVRITSGGNVGIGTASPTARLQVRGANEISTFFDAQNEGAAGATFSRIGNSYPFNQYTFANGVVGIGTSSPTSILHTSDASGATRITVDNTANAAAGAGIYMRTFSGGSMVSNATIRTDNAGVFAIFTGTSSDTERMRITSGGALLVGKTDSNVDIGDGLRIDSDGSIYASIANAESTYWLRDITNTTYRFRVSGAGTVFATNTTISSISDERLKENIRDLDSGLDKIMLLKPRVFDWKEGSGQSGKDVRGFIAQEVEEHFPELIDEWSNENLEEDEVPYKSVRMDIIPLLVKSIQELKAEIEALKSQING